jgi:hypothetical protein
MHAKTAKRSRRTKTGKRVARSNRFKKSFAGSWPMGTRALVAIATAATVITLLGVSTQAPVPTAATVQATPEVVTRIEPPPPVAAEPRQTRVTIAGCLERDDESFRLKDTAGGDAPKGRSWKTAFLKKRSQSIDVIEAANQVKLADHVGERVSVTGTLVDREMRVRSLQRLSASCDLPSRTSI